MNQTVNVAIAANGKTMAEAKIEIQNRVSARLRMAAFYPKTKNNLILADFGFALTDGWVSLRKFTQGRICHSFGISILDQRDKGRFWPVTVCRFLTQSGHAPASFVALAKALRSVSCLTPRFSQAQGKVCARRVNVTL
jgi:hypothetical protein